VYEVPEDGTDLSRNSGIAKDCTDVFVIFAFVRFYKRMFLVLCYWYSIYRELLWVW